MAFLEIYSGLAKAAAVDPGLNIPAKILGQNNITTKTPGLNMPPARIQDHQFTVELAVDPAHQDLAQMTRMGQEMKIVEDLERITHQETTEGIILLDLETGVYMFLEKDNPNFQKNFNFKCYFYDKEGYFMFHRYNYSICHLTPLLIFYL